MTLEILEDAINLVSSRLENFKFRPNQKQIILKILKAQHIDNKKAFVLEAPTGSGKSIIALIFSLVNEHLGKSGYLLTSDLMLQDQYVNDIKKYKLNVPSVKGIDNYLCTVNGLKHSLGECRKTRTKPSDLDCYSMCPYFTARNLAQHAKVSLLNYSYFLIQRNYVDRLGNGKFTVRDFTVCDEAHKVPGIVQNHFSPRISNRTTEMYEDLSGTLLLEEYDFVPDKFMKQRISKVMNLNKEDYQTIYSTLMGIYMSFTQLESACGKFIEQLPIHQRELYTDFYEKLDFIHDFTCKIEDFIEIMNTLGKESCIYNLDITKEEANRELVLNCILERKMVDRFLNKKVGFMLILSATLGNLDEYSKKCGLDLYDIEKRTLLTDWNFEKSPIYGFKTPTLNMSSKSYVVNLKNCVNMLEQILTRHKSERGVIHSVSFNFAKDIYERLSKENRQRLLMYSNTYEKDLQLKKLSKITNGVLIGPSLVEGLNLEDDLSRFCIFTKVPYPYLGDELISKKLKYFPEEYSYETSLAIQQGVGRIVRSPNDYGITYLIDSSFHYYFNKNHQYFPKEFLKRLKFL